MKQPCDKFRSEKWNNSGHIFVKLLAQFVKHERCFARPSPQSRVFFCCSYLLCFHSTAFCGEGASTNLILQRSIVRRYLYELDAKGIYRMPFQAHAKLGTCILLAIFIKTCSLQFCLIVNRFRDIDVENLLQRGRCTHKPQ